jgi:hypothetical protein
MNIIAHPAPEPRLGIFWFCGVGRKQSGLVSISRPGHGTSTIMDQRQLTLSHEEGWQHVQSLSAQWGALPFDHFPRGAWFGIARPVNGGCTSIKSYCAVLSSWRSC